MHRVSVVIPYYNSDQYLNSAIESAVSQEGVQIEIVLVVDHASRAPQVAPQFSETVRIVRNTLGYGGAGVARFLGALHARNRFIAFLDADDLWLPQKLAVQINFMLRDRAYLSFTSYENFSAAGTYGSTLIADREISYDDFIRKRVTCGCLTAIVDTSYGLVFPQVTLKKRNDYQMWFGLFKQVKHEGCRVMGYSIVSARHRFHSNSLTSNVVGAAVGHYRFLRLNFKRRTAVKYFASYAFHTLAARLKMRFSD